MQNITTYAQLKSAITLLESEQNESKQELMAEFHTTYKKIRNFSIISSVVKSIMTLTGKNVSTGSNASTGNNALNNSAGLAAGYLINKIVAGNSDNKYRKVLGSVLQFGATQYIFLNPQIISKAGLFIMQFLPRKKQNTSPESF